MVGRRAVSVTLALLVQPALSAGAHDEPLGILEVSLFFSGLVVICGVVGSAAYRVHKNKLRLAPGEVLVIDADGRNAMKEDPDEEEGDEMPGRRPPSRGATEEQGAYLAGLATG